MARAGAPNTETECYWPLTGYSRTENLVESFIIFFLGCIYHDHVEPCLGVLSTSEHHFTVLAVDLQLDGEVASLGCQIHVFYVGQFNLKFHSLKPSLQN